MTSVIVSKTREQKRDGLKLRETFNDTPLRMKLVPTDTEAVDHRANENRLETRLFRLSPIPLVIAAVIPLRLFLLLALGVTRL